MQTAFGTVVHIYKTFKNHISNAASIDSVDDRRSKVTGARGSTNRTTRNSGSGQMEEMSIQEGREWGARSRASSSKLSDEVQYVEDRPRRVRASQVNTKASRGSGGAKANSSPFFASHAGSSKRIDHEDELVRQQAEGKTKRKGGRAHQLLGPTPQETFYKENRNGRLPPEAVGGLRKLGQSSNTDYFEDSFDDDRPEPSTSTTRSGRSTAKAGPMDHTPMVGSSSATKSRAGPTKAGGAFGAHRAKGTANSPAGSDDDDIPIAVDQVDTKPSGRSRGGAPKPRDFGNDPKAPPLGKTKGERPKPEESPQTSTGNTGKTSTKRTTAPKKATGRSNMPSHFTSMVVRSFLQVNPVTEMFATTLNWDFPSSRCTLHIDKKQFALNPKSAESDSQACPDTDCPFICFWFDTERESSLADSLRHHFGVQSFHRSFGITLLLEAGGENGQLVQSIMNKIKSVPDGKFDHLNSSGVRSNLEGLEQQMITDRKSTKGVNRPQIAAAADGRGEREMDRKARKSVAETDAQQYSGKPPKKPNKKGKEKEGELEEDQPKLSFDKKAPKRGRKGEPIDLASGSPEAAKVRPKSLRQARNSNSKTPNYSLDLADEDDEFQPAPVAPSTPMPPRPENWHGVLFPYPLQGRADINITEGDRWRVEAQDFLNDTLIEFGLKHVLANISELIGDTHVNVEKDVHLFNSFFYEKLSSGSKPAEGTTDTPWAAYQSVRKWTKSKKVFEKKYLIIPINENAHWYLAVIYNPAGILREYVEPVEPVEDTPAPEIPAVDEPTAAAPIDVDQESSAPVTARDDDAVKQKSPSPKPTTQADEPESSLRSQPPSTLETDFEIQPSPQPGPSTRSRRGGRASTPRRSLSPDVIARSDQITERHTRESSPDILLSNIPRSRLSPVASTVKISRSKFLKRAPKPGDPLPSEHALRNPSPMPPSPEPTPIMNPTVAAYASQNLPDVPLPAEEVEEPLTKTEVPPSETKQPAASKAPIKKKEPLKIWEGDDTWIMTFDSLGGAHKPVERILKLWLEYEAVDKVAERPARFTPSKYKEARVPQQPNFSDCGLYLIHFVEQLLKRPEEIIRHIELYIPPNQGKVRQEWFRSVNNVWNDGDTQHLRKTWTGIIDSLTAKYTEIKKALLPAAPADEVGKGEEAERDVEPEIAQVDKSQSSVTQLSQLPLAPAGANAMEDMLRQLGKAMEEEAEKGMEGIEEGSGAVIVHGTEDVEMIDQDQAGSLELELKVDKGKGKERQSASPGLLDSPSYADTHKAISNLEDYGSTASPPPAVGDEERVVSKDDHKPPSTSTTPKGPLEQAVTSILHRRTTRVPGVSPSKEFTFTPGGLLHDKGLPAVPVSPIVANLAVDPRLRANVSAQTPPEAKIVEHAVSQSKSRPAKADEPRSSPSRSRYLSPEPVFPNTAPAPPNLLEELHPIDEEFFEGIEGRTPSGTPPEVPPPMANPTSIPGPFPRSDTLLQQRDLENGRLENGRSQRAHGGSVRTPVVGKELDDDEVNDEEDEELETMEYREVVDEEQEDEPHNFPTRMVAPPETAAAASESVTTGRSDHSDSGATSTPSDGYPSSQLKPASLSTPPPSRPNPPSSQSDRSHTGRPYVLIDNARSQTAHRPLVAGPPNYLWSPQNLGATAGQSNGGDEPPQSQHTRFPEEDEEGEVVADSPPKAPKSKGKAKSTSAVDATEITPNHRPVFLGSPNAPVLQLSRAKSPIPHGSAAGPYNGGDNLSQSQHSRLPVSPSGEEEDEEVEVLAVSPPKPSKSKGKAKSTSAVDATKTTPTHKPGLPISPNAPVLRSSKTKPPIPHESSFPLPANSKDLSSPLSELSASAERARTSPSLTLTVSHGSTGLSEAETEVLFPSQEEFRLHTSSRRPLITYGKAKMSSVPMRGGQSSNSRTVDSDLEDIAEDTPPIIPKQATNRKRGSPSKSTPAKPAKAKRSSSGHGGESSIDSIDIPLHFKPRARSSGTTASSEDMALAASSRSQPILDAEPTSGRVGSKKRKGSVGGKKAGPGESGANGGEDETKAVKKARNAPRASGGEGSGKQRANGNTGGVKGSTSASTRPGSRQNPPRLNLNHGPRGEGPGKGGDTRASPLEIDSDSN